MGIAIKNGYRAEYVKGLVRSINYFKWSPDCCVEGYGTSFLVSESMHHINLPIYVMLYI